MIHAIELENFKGVGARTRIDLAPVTLLFGANNVGKSTIRNTQPRLVAQRMKA